MTKRETKSELDGLCPKRYAGTADHPGGCPGQNILEIKNSWGKAKKKTVSEKCGKTSERK